MEKIGKDCWDWDPWPFGTIPFCHPEGKVTCARKNLCFLLTTRTNSAWQRQERRCHLYIWLQYAWIFPVQLGRTTPFVTRKMLKKDGKKHKKNQPNAVTVCFLAKIHQSHWQEGSNCCWWCRATIGCETWDGWIHLKEPSPPTGHGGPTTCSLTCGGHELYPVMSSLGYLTMQATRLLFGSLGPRNQTRDNGVWHDKR